MAVTPADPSVTGFTISAQAGSSFVETSIPTVGTEDEELNSDSLYYIVWVKKGDEQQKYISVAAAYRTSTYNLCGQKVSSLKRGNLYIVNGKKLIAR